MDALPTEWPALREPTFREWCHDVKARRQHLEVELQGASGVCTLDDARNVTRLRLAHIQPNDACHIRRLMRGEAPEYRKVHSEEEWRMWRVWHACERGTVADVRAALEHVQSVGDALEWREDCLYGARTALEVAVQRGDPEMLAVLCRHQRAHGTADESDTLLGEVLLAVATRGDAGMLHVLLAAGVSLAYADTTMRRTALHWACWENCVACVRTLLAAGADPLLKDVYGWSAGFGACHAGAEETLAALLAARVPIPDVSRTHMGWSPLHKAIFLSNDRTFSPRHASLLLRAGAQLGMLGPAKVRELVDAGNAAALSWVLALGVRPEVCARDSAPMSERGEAMLHRCGMRSLLDTGAMRAGACVQLLRGLAGSK